MIIITTITFIIYDKYNRCYMLGITVMEKEFTTIQISKELKDILKNLGKKGESYDTIIWRLVNKENKNKKC